MPVGIPAGRGAPGRADQRPEPGGVDEANLVQVGDHRAAVSDLAARDIVQTARAEPVSQVRVRP